MTWRYYSTSPNENRSIEITDHSSELRVALRRTLGSVRIILLTVRPLTDPGTLRFIMNRPAARLRASPHRLRGRECEILPAGVNVVTVRLGLLSERLLGEEWQERATSKCPDYRDLGKRVAGSRRRPGESRMQAAIAAQPVGEGGNHRLYTESCTSVQGFSLSFTGTESGRSEQRASALTGAVSAMAWLKTVGG